VAKSTPRSSDAPKSIFSIIYLVLVGKGREKKGRRRGRGGEKSRRPTAIQGARPRCHNSAGFAFKYPERGEGKKGREKERRGEAERGNESATAQLTPKSSIKLYEP